MVDSVPAAEWIKARRKALDITQADLALRVPVRATIKKIEAGDLRPSAQLAELLVAALAIPAEQRAAFLRFARRRARLRADAAPGGANAAEPAHQRRLQPRRELHYRLLCRRITCLRAEQRPWAAPPNSQSFERLLAEQTCRAVTITGAGGAGKTTLALQCAADLIGCFPDGVFFVDLAPLQHATAIPGALAHVLGQPEVVGMALTAAIVELLRPRIALLVIDNFEHLLEGAALVTELVDGCPGIKVLATSRAALHVRGEQEFPLAPLPVPAGGPVAPLADLASLPSVALFVQRARLVRPDFALNDANAAAIAEICIRLDGLPLALELAAARVRALAPAEIAALLRASGGAYGSPLDLLASRTHGLPDRQRTLRGAIAWSYDLLAPEEQRLLRLMAVFASGATLNAIAAVVAGPQTPAGALLATLDQVTSLVDKSLLVVRDTEYGSRYDILQTIREFALEQLATVSAATGEETVARTTHAAYLLDMAEAYAQRLRGPEQGEILQRIELEQDNLRTALAWLLAEDDGAGRTEAPRDRLLVALRLAGALRWFWLRREHEREGRTWLERALAGLGWPQAPAPADLAAPLAQAYSALGDMAWVQSDHSRSAHCHRQSAELYRQLGDAAGVAFADNALAAQLIETGQLDAAVAQAEAAVALARRAGGDWTTVLALVNLGVARQQQGEIAAAQATLQEARTLCANVQDVYASVITLHNLGDVLRIQQQDEAAIQLFEESIELARQVGFASLVTASLAALGKIDLRHRRLAAARLHFSWGLEFAQRQHRPGVTLECLDGLAMVAALEGNGAAAAQLFGAIEHQRLALDYPRLAEEQAVYAERLDALRRRRLEQAWATGARWLLAEVVDFALKSGEGVQLALGERAVPQAVMAAT